MKEKHSGMNKKVKNGTRVLIALLIAAAFILPVGTIMAEPPKIPDDPEDNSLPVKPVYGPWNVASAGPYTIDRNQVPAAPGFEAPVEAIDLATGDVVGELKPSTEPDDTTGTRVDAWVRYDQATNTDAVGLTAGGWFEWAARFTPTELAGYNGYTLDTVQFHYGYGEGTGSAMAMTITVYGQGTAASPGPVITTQNFNAPLEGWYDVPLTNPVTIDATKEYWVAIKCTHAAGQYPAGCNSGYGTPGKGSWAQYEGSGWTDLATYAWTWNIAAGLTAGGGGGGGEFEWNAVVKYIYIEKEVWDPASGEYITIPTVIHVEHEQACKNEYIHEDVESYIQKYAPYPDEEDRCNNFPPGELFIGAEIGNHGNNTYINLPVHLNVWKQIYDEILVSDFEDHVFSDWLVIDGGGCVHPYPDGDSWNMSTARAHSGTTSMHVSKTASYMKGANDTLRNRYPLNTHGGDCAEITFWFWVEGDYDSYPWKAYDYLQVYWIQRPHSGPEIRHGPLNVMVTEPGPTWYWDSQADWGVWGGDHGQPMCWNSGGPGPYWYSDPVWAKGVIEVPDEWKCDQTFLEFVWKADCMDQYEGAYIDDVVISRVINQGEKVYSANEQVTLAPGEQKFIRFTPSWGECCPPEHGKYWIEVRVKTHSNFVADENPADDWIKDEVIISCHHDVGVTELIVDPFEQTAGDVFSYLIPTNVSFTVKNYSPYDDEFDVKMTVRNMEYGLKFSDDAESGNKGWEHGSFTDGPDLWHITTRDASSPTHSWAAMESDVGFYDNGMWNYLLSPTLNFEGLKDAYVCWNAKWALERYDPATGKGDYWQWFIYDPYSNFIIRFGPAFTGCSGDWLPDYDGHPMWITQKNPAGIGPFLSTTLISGQYDLRYHYMCMPIYSIMEWLNDYGFDWLGVEMFGPRGDPELRGGFGFTLITDGSIREAECNDEKWSGLFIDDVNVFTVSAGETVYEDTWTVLLPSQGGEQTIDTQYCWPGIWGDFEVDIETLLETDCNPDNNWMDGYNHIYYSYWFDNMEEYTYYDTSPFEGDWTHEPYNVEDGHWHVVHNIDPVEGYQDYWWCGPTDDYLYGPDYNDCLTSPIFDLYSMIPRSPWQYPAVQLTFRMCYHLDIGDEFYVEVSNDSGRNWFPIQGWFGPEQSDCWHDYNILIPQNFYTETFMFRFRFYSDGDYENKGVLLDDIILEALKGKNATMTTELIKEESMFATVAAWRIESLDVSTNCWIRTTSTPHQSGVAHARETYGSSSAPDNDWLITPAINCSSGNPVNFWVGEQSSVYDEYMQVWVTKTGNMANDFLTGGVMIANLTIDCYPTYYEYYSIPLPTAYKTPGVYIAFRNVGLYELYLNLDDVTLPNGQFEGFESTTFPPQAFANFPPIQTEPYANGQWMLIDYNGDGIKWEPSIDTAKAPTATSGVFVIADSDGHTTATYADGFMSPPIDIMSATPAGTIFQGATLEYDVNFDLWSSDYGAVILYMDGEPVSILKEYTADFKGHETLMLPYADGLQVEFYYDTQGLTYQNFFAVDNIKVNVTYETITAEGDPLAWYFEDDAETGGNPLWTVSRCGGGGDLWRAYCYPVVTQPVYSTFGEIISPPVMEECPDEDYLPASEPWLFPPPSGEHFWMCEKHHTYPFAYYDGNTYWPPSTYSYLNNMDDILISPEIDLTGCYHGHVYFWIAGGVADFNDQFWVMIREKNAAGTWGDWNYIEGDGWQGPVDITTSPYRANPAGILPLPEWIQVTTVEQYYRDIGYWTRVLADDEHPYFMIDLMGYLPPLSDYNPTIQIGFRFISDESGVSYGVKIDDLLVAVKRDTIAPITTCDITGTLGCNNWYTSAVSVRLTPTDDLVGTKATYYRVDGGAWQLYTDRFQVTADGQHTVEYYSVDTVGNVEGIKTCTGFKIDQTDPTVALALPESGYLYLMGRPILQIGRTIVIGDLTAQATASDAASGTDYVEFLVDGEVKSADLDAPFTFDLPKGGLMPKSHTLQIKAYDNACNSATSTQLTYTKWF